MSAQTDTPAEPAVDANAKWKAWFEEFIHAIECRVTKSTIQGRRAAMERLLKTLGNTEISYKSVSDYLTAMYNRGMNTNSIQHYWQELQAFFSWTIREGKSDWKLDNTTRHPLSASKRLPLLEEHYARLLKTIALKDRFKKIEFAIRTGWETGLRMGDVCQLKWSQVNIKLQALVIVPRKTKRLNRVIEFPLSDEYFKYLMGLREVRDMNSPYVDPYSAHLHEWGGKDFGKHVYYLFKMSHLPKDVSFHSFRVGWITRMAARGMSPVMISDMVGIDIKTVMMYCKPTLDDKRAAIEACKNFDAKAEVPAPKKHVPQYPEG